MFPSKEYRQVLKNRVGVRCLFPSLPLPGVDGSTSVNFIRCMLEKDNPLDVVCRNENVTEDIAIRIVPKKSKQLDEVI
jgi:hypothetical protein